jgi:hypothetical protein
VSSVLRARARSRTRGRTVGRPVRVQPPDVLRASALLLPDLPDDGAPTWGQLASCVRARACDEQRGGAHVQSPPGPEHGMHHIENDDLFQRRLLALRKRAGGAEDLRVLRGDAGGGLLRPQDGAACTTGRRPENGSNEQRNTHAEVNGAPDHGCNVLRLSVRWVCAAPSSGAQQGRGRAAEAGQRQEKQGIPLLVHCGVGPDVGACVAGVGGGVGGGAGVGSAGAPPRQAVL